MKTYICTVSNKFPENYQIGIQAGLWGVEEKYKNRILKVQQGDQLVFIVGGVYRTLHRIESQVFKDENPLWPEKDGSIFPYRIKISKPIKNSNQHAKTLAPQISFMKDKFWGGTIQGAAGVFNDKLNNDDVKLIFGKEATSFLKAKPSQPKKIELDKPKKTSGLTFVEKDAENAVEKLLPDMGLTKYVDKDTGKDGRQFQCSAGRIDLLCIDNSTKDFVVIELKRGKAPDATLLQILRYMSWVRQNLAIKQNVKGIIMSESIDQSLSGMLNEVPNVSVQYFKFEIKLINP